MANRKRFQKVYLEISNICNLRCSFCPGTKRPAGRMDEEIFRSLLPKLRPYTDFLYFHLMGEPLGHPQLEQFLALAGDAGFRVILTTNGTLLNQHTNLLDTPGLHKINISLHAFEANDLRMSFSDYLDGCIIPGVENHGRKLVVYRLWNGGGSEAKNPQILEALKEAFPQEWVTGSRGIQLSEKVYLEYGDKFDWPDLSAQERSGHFFCYGLRDQLGVLWDGTVVPCCLDHEGDIALGNLVFSDLETILQSPRAEALYEGFSQGKAAERLCRHCGYASRFR